MKRKVCLGASIGNCVHVAGVAHFLAIAEEEGYETIFLGPAVALQNLFEAIDKYKPDIVGISYRLTPENVIPLLDAVEENRKKLNYSPKWVFGGTKPVADIAKKYKFFSFISDGYDDINDSIRFLRGGSSLTEVKKFGNTLEKRLEESYPYPLLRHHFGLPSLTETESGIRKISEAKVLDVISLGTDQNAQQFLFHKENMKAEYNGAGGVPIRSKEDLLRLKRASECGNFPLMRCYSGTEDVFQYAELLKDTIQNAWSAIPLCWYNELDGRGTRPLEVSILEAQELIKWHAAQGIPVEINEPHHWSLRDAHDVIPVVMAYISAYNAKKLGVRHYISQYMFNVPSGISFSMDLARILAMMEMTESLNDEGFHAIRETRAGLPLFCADPDVAKGQLAASTFMQMIIRPHIMHVVAYCEANHAAQAEDVIESCKIVKGVIRHTLNDTFSVEKDSWVLERKNELLREANVVLDFIKKEYSDYDDPLTNSEVLAECVKKGYIDAPHIVKNQKYCGNLATKFKDGKCLAYDKESSRFINEAERLQHLLNREALDV